MFGCFFKKNYGLNHHPGKDFETEADAIDYAKLSLEASPGYLTAVVTDKGFPILELEG